MRRLTTMLAATALLAGGAGAVPAQAAPDPGPRIMAGSTDPAGDAEGRTAAGRAAADLRGVEYHAPVVPDGEMRFRFRFAKLHNGNRAGAPRQRAAVTLVKSGPKNFRVWVVEADNVTSEVTVRSQHGGEITRIIPETSKVRRTFTRGGAVVVTVSSEWLPVKRAMVQGYGLSGRAMDPARRVRMDLSGDAGTVSEPTSPAPAREATR